MQLVVRSGSTDSASTYPIVPDCDAREGIWLEAPPECCELEIACAALEDVRSSHFSVQSSWMQPLPCFRHHVRLNREGVRSCVSLASEAGASPQNSTAPSAALEAMPIACSADAGAAPRIRLELIGRRSLRVVVFWEDLSVQFVERVTLTPEQPVREVIAKTCECVGPESGRWILESDETLINRRKRTVPGASA